MDSFYTYKPIDHTTNTIRVLRLCKSYHTDTITCELVETFLEDNGVPYEALSYTWGHSSVGVEIMLDGHKKSIGSNLHVALHCLRLVEEDRWLWVDALCINQDDPREKNHQVGLMRQIYEKANRVLVWLGQTDDDVNLLFDLMEGLEKRVWRNGAYRKNDPTAWPLQIKKLGGIETESNRRRHGALVNLLKRPWFQRVWILQEAFSAKRATILCGWRNVSAETFVIMPELMGVQVDEHVQSVLDIMPGHLRKFSWRKQEPNLRTLLKKFSQSKATDPRDKIYALLGMASDILSNGGSGLEPNYTIPLLDAIQHTISYLTFGESPGSPTCQLPDWDFQTFVGYIDELPWHIAMWAIHNGIPDTLREILARTNVDINSAPSGLDAPLLYLARNSEVQTWENTSHIAACMIISQPGVRINLQDSQGNTPLHIAARKGGADLVNQLLARQDVEANGYNSEWKTPLGVAVENGRDGVVKTMLATKKVDVDYLNGNPRFQQFTALWLAITSPASSSTAELLLQGGANIKAAAAPSGETALYAAVETGNYLKADLLLKHGADIEERNGNGKTPIWAAVEKGHLTLLDLLLTRGATLDEEEKIITTVWDRGLPLLCGNILWAAAATGRQDMIRRILRVPGASGLLLEKKGGRDKATALWIAARRGYPDAVAALLEAGADATARDLFNHTPLWGAIYCISHNHSQSHPEETAKLLIRRGARLERGDAVGDYGPFGRGLRKDEVVRLFSEEGMEISEIEAMVATANRRM